MTQGQTAARPQISKNHLQGIRTHFSVPDCLADELYGLHHPLKGLGNLQRVDYLQKKQLFKPVGEISFLHVDYML